jgi:hypothetical protein
MEKAKKTPTAKHDNPIKPNSLSNTMLLYQEAKNERLNVTVNMVVHCCQAINKGLERILKRPLNSL